jgi:hypothetical protein
MGRVTNDGYILGITCTATIALAAMVVCTTHGNTFWCGFGVMDNCRTVNAWGKFSGHGIG